MYLINARNIARKNIRLSKGHSSFKTQQFLHPPLGLALGTELAHPVYLFNFLIRLNSHHCHTQH